MQLRFLLFGIVLLVIILYFSKSIRDEGFYAEQSRIMPAQVPVSQEPSAGPTTRDVEQAVQQTLVARDLQDMTETPAEPNEESYQDFHSSLSQ